MENCPKFYALSPYFIQRQAEKFYRVQDDGTAIPPVIYDQKSIVGNADFSVGDWTTLWIVSIDPVWIGIVGDDGPIRCDCLTRRDCYLVIHPASAYHVREEDDVKRAVALEERIRNEELFDSGDDFVPLCLIWGTLASAFQSFGDIRGVFLNDGSLRVWAGPVTILTIRLESSIDPGSIYQKYKDGWQTIKNMSGSR